MSAVIFRVYGEPQSKARARSGNGNHYTPESTVDAEAEVVKAFLPRRKGPPTKARVSVAVHFNVATKTRRDIDNLAKLVLDALNGHAWVDDAQVDELHLYRTDVPKGQASTLVTFCEVDASRIAPLETP